MTTKTTKTEEKGIKAGQKPVSEKIDIKEYLSTQEHGRGLLRFPPDVEKFAKKHGIQLCWRSYQTLSASGGYDPDGWIVFRREMLKKDPEFANCDTIDRVEFEFGGHTSPVYRRGDLILGYMMADQWNADRKREQQRALRASSGSKSVDQIQSRVGSGLKIKNLDDE